MMRLIVVLALVAQSFAFTIPRATDCEINVDNFRENVPVIVKGGTGEFLYPEPPSTIMTVADGASADLVCAGGTISGGEVAVNAVCNAGSFEVNGKQTVIYSLRCSRAPFHTAHLTGETCEGNGSEAEIGYIVDETTFIRQIKLCFDKDAQSTLYSQYFLTKSIGAHESGVPRPSFIQDDDFYTVPSVNSLYERNAQRSTINQLVGLSSSSTKYVSSSGDYFLSRGHFTAKADFVYAIQQKATFHYVNVAPQWQVFNGGNWNSLEIDLRDFADSSSLDLVVFTGSYGVATLPHEDTKEETELYLYVNSNGNNGIPIPKLYWKVAYDEANKAGIAFVGVNNPYITELGDNIICEDISSEINWLNWDATNIKLGYSYVCTVDDLRKTVPHIPDLDVQSLLK